MTQPRTSPEPAAGAPVPSFLYGTAWKEERTLELTSAALRSGFRGLDTANQRRHYHEAAVGDALAAGIEAGIVRRGDIFLQTKFTFLRGQDHRLPYDPDAAYPDQVRQSFASSLEHLRTSYIDSYVLHGPSTSAGLTAADWEVWRAMEGLHSEGQAKRLGVSNVGLDQLRELCEGSAVPPAFVQNRCFARNGWDRAVRRYCQQHQLRYQGFSLLTANAAELATPEIKALLQRIGRSLPEVVFRFAQRLGMLPLTGTSSVTHMQADLACHDVPLTDDDLALIACVAAPAPRDGLGL